MKTILLFAFTAVSIIADTEFRVGKMKLHDPTSQTGECDIHLRVDEEATVRVQGDLVTVQTLSGREARDEGSECGEPLPGRGIQGFRFEVRNGRGKVILLSPPSQRNEYTAIVRIRDAAGGAGHYHFRLTWRIERYGPGDEQAVRLCEEAVARRIVEQYHDANVEIQDIHADDNRGRKDYLLGEASAHRGFRQSAFTFICAIDFSSGRLRSIDVRKR